MFECKIVNISYPSILTYVLGAQKNRLNETVILSTHNICFGWEIRKLNFRYTLLTKVLYTWTAYRPTFMNAKFFSVKL